MRLLSVDVMNCKLTENIRVSKVAGLHSAINFLITPKLSILSSTYKSHPFYYTLALQQLLKAALVSILLIMHGLIVPYQAPHFVVFQQGNCRVSSMGNGANY